MTVNAYPGAGTPPQRNDRKILIQVLVAVALVAVIAVVGVVLVLRKTANADDAVTRQPLPATPQNVAADGSVRVGAADAKVVVRLVADLQCPACQTFEKYNGAVLEDVVAKGEAAVEYSIITFLDRASTDKYSSRAGNASYCVANTGTGNYQKWLTAMFEQQPHEGGAGLSDSKLIDIAESAGYTDSSVAQCITERTYDGYLRQKTEEVFATGVNSTPTVLINGTQVPNRQLGTENGLAAAIAAAR
ncbi:thioredoxin domain-containing protein [Nocardia sp. XZ_19_385]|uniref:DsbA family protein n=1 Tax=Nocardia sp. XZ_19_385 TaxID=2769488 RepID=UPI0018906048|nr:thioredoxin domain-containing protein [Nocardia sp. XZ_19_385]